MNKTLNYEVATFLFVIHYRPLAIATFFQYYLILYAFSYIIYIHRFSDISLFRVSLHVYQFFIIKIFSEDGKFKTDEIGSFYLSFVVLQRLSTDIFPTTKS